MATKLRVRLKNLASVTERLFLLSKSWIFGQLKIAMYKKRYLTEPDQVFCPETWVI